MVEKQVGKRKIALFVSCKFCCWLENNLAIVNSIYNSLVDDILFYFLSVFRCLRFECKICLWNFNFLGYFIFREN
jgi:hypothetical protein